MVHGQGEVGVSNSTFIIEGKRACVVDTMTFPEMAQGIVREIARRGARTSIVVNTHHHIDHMGGNELFTDAQVIAHPASIQALQHLGFPASLYDHLMPQFRGRFADLSLRIPDPLTTPPQFSLPRGGELLIFTPAHTAADTAVWFPDSRVLLTGDIGFIGVVPLSVNGLISKWIEALDTLIALNPAVVVPGHGSIGTLADLVHLRDYFLAVQRIGQAAVSEQLSPEEALAHFDPGPLTEWIESERHVINIERVMQEVRGEISATNLAVIPKSARKA
jgi:glyoxylase-like metal-dependent hydrolase (beta-lactamase superfamily II)